VSKTDIKCMAETKGGVQCPKTATGMYPMPMPFWCSQHPHTVEITLPLCVDHAPCGLRNLWKSGATDAPSNLPEDKP
jgi:hypothetical protein